MKRLRLISIYIYLTKSYFVFVLLVTYINMSNFKTRFGKILLHVQLLFKKKIFVRFALYIG